MIFRALLVSVIFISSVISSNATHIIGGEITYKLIDPSTGTYEIFITGYIDLIGGQVTFGGGTLDFGDGSEPITDIRNDSRVTILLDEEHVGYDVGVTKFRVEYTFSTNGAYLISYIEPNRNEGIINMTNSVETPFYIESLILLDNGKINNNSATLLIPVNQWFCGSSDIHIQLGAFDTDGDSLSFSLETPKMSKEQDVTEYHFPNDPKFYSDVSLTGDIILDQFGNLSMFSPSQEGEYVISVSITEWRAVDRKLTMVGKTLRDFSIIIGDCIYPSVKLDIPDSIFIKPGVITNQEFNILNSEEVNDVVIYHSILEEGSSFTNQYTGNSILVSVEVGCNQLAQPIGFLSSQLNSNNGVTVNSTVRIITDPLASQCSFLEIKGDTKIVEGNDLKVVLKNIGLKPLEISSIFAPDGISVSFTTLQLDGESEATLDIIIDEFYDGYSSVIELTSDADGGDKFILIQGVNTPLGTDGFNKQSISLYPNPASSFIGIKSNITFSHAIIYDLRGNPLTTQTLNSQKVNIEAISAGVYIVELLKGNYREIHRIIKK